MLACEPVTIDCEYSQTIDIIGAGDLHWASAESDHELWWRMFAQNPKAYYVLLGDMLHSIAPSDNRWAGSKLRDEYYTYKTLVNLIDAEIADFVTQMRGKLGDQWIAEHILGSISGNHPYLHVKKGFGFDPHDRMCGGLGIINLGYSCFLPLRIRIHPKKIRTVMIYAHHGFGGASRTEGANMTKFARHSWQYDADIFFYGHTHDKFVKKLPVIKYVPSHPPTIKEKEVRVLAQTGTFQGTLSEDEGPSWSETKGFPVRDLGWVTVHLTPKRVQPYTAPQPADGRIKKNRLDITNIEIRVEE